MKKIVVMTEFFKGSVESGGESIGPCKKGDIVTVEDRTWDVMKREMPDWFKLIAEEPEIKGVQTKSGDDQPPPPVAKRKTPEKPVRRKAKKE